MKKSHLMLGLCLSFATSSAALASMDMDSCAWASPGCFLVSPPVLGVANDTRDNLLRLLDEQKGFSSLRQPVPTDITRSRDFYFGMHMLDYDPPVDDDSDTTPGEDPLSQQIATLGLDAEAITHLTALQDENENRFVSLNSDTLSDFFAALLADTTLTPELRQTLAKTRLLVDGSSNAQDELNKLTVPEGSAAAFRDYLQAANQFYAGNYTAARQSFTALSSNPQPWIAETASYMLMRNALNASSENANGEYGDFDVTKVDKTLAQQARDSADTYLKKWPQGKYADSTQGLLRRINWYLQDWNTLATLYEHILPQAADSDALSALINESDNKLLSKDLTWGDGYFLSAPDASLLTFIQTLRLMRDNQCENHAHCVDQAYLDGLKADFEKNKRADLWNYLRLMLAYNKQDYATVVKDITPAQSLPEHNILAFSEQALYGDALMGQQQWDAARDHWLHLLDLSKDVEQQQLLQAKLAATLVNSNALEKIFAPDSRITNLRYRSLVMKTKATPELLRQQAGKGPNNEERTIALHTLLTQDLAQGHYADWLQDKSLLTAITAAIPGEAFDDVDVSVFKWTGTDPEKAYACASLNDTVGVLSKNPQDGHALNCLGEFFRTTQTEVSLAKDRGGNDALDVATRQDDFSGKPHRLAWYQQVINDTKAEPEDKSYALYRAVMCYAPSGYNDCGGEDVDKAVRKAWFLQLKRDYPGSVWAKSLKYYW